MSTTDTSRWFKATYSNGNQNCVEIRFGGWFKSSRSNGNQNCVETRFASDVVLIRDSKYQGDPAAQPIITVPAELWPIFLRTALGTETHIPRIPIIELHSDGGATLRADDIALNYTPGEWDAFTAGVRDGEFDQAEAAA